MGYNTNVNIKVVWKTAARTFYTGLLDLALSNRDSLSEEQISAIFQIASYMLASTSNSIDDAPMRSLKGMIHANSDPFYHIIEKADVHNDDEFEEAINKVMDIMTENFDTPVYDSAMCNAPESEWDNLYPKHRLH